MSLSSKTRVGLACLLLGSAAALGHLRPVAAQPAPPQLPIEIAGATFLEYDDTTGVLRAEGSPVVVTRGPTELRASRIRYDARTRTVNAAGGVSLAEPGLTLQADTADLALSDNRIRASGHVVMRSVRETDAATLSAMEVEGSLQTRRFVATGPASVTRGEWILTGRRFEYDDRTRTGVVTGEPMLRYRTATLTAETITFDLAEERARAEGMVRIQRGEFRGRAPRADVSGRDGVAVLSGGAQVDRGAERLTAETIEIQMDGSRVTARGSPRLVIMPP